MKRNSFCKRILTGGVVLSAAACLLGSQIQAQSTSGMAPPGMEESGSPFGSGSRGPTTFMGRPTVVQKPAVSTSRAEVHGVTRYPSGLPIPGAEVAILNGDVGIDLTIVSDSDGSFVFKNLKPGEYQLTAKKEGFALSPITKVQLAAGNLVTVEVPLGASLAVSPANNNSAVLLRTFNQSGYRLQPASLRLDSTAPTTDAATSTINTPTTESPNPPGVVAAQPIPVAVADELNAMRKRIDELESELKTRGTAEQPAETPAVAPAGTPAAAATPQDQAAPPVKLLPGQYLAAGGTATYFKGDTDLPTHPDGFDTFSYADWTWMNANGRQHDSPWSTKYFTPEFRADVNYMDSFNHPRDNSMGGSTETFRSNEWQLEQVSLGGDIRIGHARGRILTMFGEFATTTPRNDGSTSRGQWDLRGMYKYISEGWGGYHFDVNHGLNVDAGIFVSYIGLFSYYNFDNWAYQPSYVSSNTPWFFNGLRIQWFPTSKLKIEPWIINGWQSYARFNSKPGLGGQILWRPKPYLSLVFNDYGMGTDVLGSPGASRIHADYSAEIREYNNPDGFLDMAAMSITGDAGCQYGATAGQATQNCFNNKNGGVKTAFLGWMAYERLQFKHDMYGITLGGGMMTNPGRYLTLLPPINGADAISGSPYFTANLGDKAHMYDATATFDYMPSQWVTFRAEMQYRHSDVPYWSGHGGITPPGGLPNTFSNTGSPSLYVCTNGISSVADVKLTPSGNGFYQSSSVTPAGDNGGPAGTQLANPNSVDSSCQTQQGPGWVAWAPDLRKQQIAAGFMIMTRF